MKYTYRTMRSDLVFPLSVISNLNLFLFGILLSSNWANMCKYFLLVTQDVEENYKQYEQTHRTKNIWLEPRSQAQHYYELEIHF